MVSRLLGHNGVPCSCTPILRQGHLSLCANIGEPVSGPCRPFCTYRSNSPCLCRSLRAAIQRYKETQPKNDFWENFNPDSCSWDQVVAELDETTSFYRTKAEGNAIRRSFRGPGVSRNMGPLLESIPQDNGLGVLKGGLLIIFNVRAKFGMLSLVSSRAKFANVSCIV